jgi:hypothetical protein
MMRRKAKVSASFAYSELVASLPRLSAALLISTFNNIMIGLMISSTPYKKSISRTEGDKEGSRASLLSYIYCM